LFQCDDICKNVEACYAVLNLSWNVYGMNEKLNVQRMIGMLNIHKMHGFD